VPSASASRKPAEIGPALQQALMGRPVMIDVVSDIEALAPVAVTK